MTRSDFFFKNGSISLIGIWLSIFALVPLLLVLMMSVLTPNEESFYTLPVTLSNYAMVFTPLYLHVFLRSLLLAGVVTLVCLLLGYPFAFFISTIKRTALKPVLLALMIIPFLCVLVHLNRLLYQDQVPKRYRR
jgi:spermidine/putrescine transport system permease protein